MANKNSNNNKKKMNIVFLIGIVLIILLNYILSSQIKDKTVEEVSYSSFLEMVDNGEIDTITEEDSMYKFTKKEQSGVVQYYTVGKWDDPDITDRLIKNGVKFSSEIPEEVSPVLYYLLTLIGPILLFYILGRLLSKNLMKAGGGDAMSFGKSNAKVYVKAQTGITFRDVAGQDEAKDSLMEVVDFLHNPKKYADIGATGPKGVLLVGPPGTGKTLLAKAVAGESNVPFFSISGSEFVEMFVGMGASKVRDLFKQAKEKAPCIVFIDEIDTIGKKRDTRGYSGNDEREQTLNQLLNEMDGFDGSEGVVILAATNRPEVLDPALIRPGRFDRQIRVELPDIKGREEILAVHARKVRMDPNADLKQIAKMTAGASGADLANIINEGALMAVRENRRYVEETDLEESVEVVIAGQKKKNAVISPKEREIIAYHEVGHALVAAKQKGTAPVTKITVIPRTSGALGYTMQVDEEEKVIMTKEQLFSEIVTFTGGRSAEELVFNTKTTGASNDIERATKLARAMVTQYGMTDEFDFVQLEERTNQYLGGDTRLTASTETAGQIDAKVAEIISSAHNKAIEILKDNMDKLHEISRYLLEKETITGKEFMDILENNSNSEILEEEKQIEE